MTKKFIGYIFLSLFVGAPALADDGSSGCGLGWMVTKRKSLLSSLVRNYTNITGSATSGMTSGTSGCDKHSIVKNEKAAEHFAESNHNQLMIEMALGQGQYLTSFAQVMGCKNADAEFAKATRSSYESIYTSDQVTPAQVIQNTKFEINKNPNLAKACNNKVG